MADFRFLLDQNFPSQTFGVEELDQTIHFIHLQAFAPELAKAKTPDWLIYLAAHNAGMDGVVTRDLEQIRDTDSLVALGLTNLCVITWATPVEDAVTEWAQLISYMPEIKKRLAEDRKRILLLPAPRLRNDQTLKASDVLGQMASEGKRTAGELRSESFKRMRQILKERKRADLLSLLDEKSGSR
jgi:hypothetical protein